VDDARNRAEYRRGRDTRDQPDGQECGERSPESPDVTCNEAQNRVKCARNEVNTATGPCAPFQLVRFVFAC
jgi:hypothetical protein